MSFDFESSLGRVQRAVTVLERDGKPARSVTLLRTYPTSVEDLWDALINPERLSRWFLPVDGDLRPGGRFQLKGNASGSITDCMPPSHLALTWEFGGDVSWVDVTLKAETQERARLTLIHTAIVNDFWTQFGPGAVGVGWDLGIVGLEAHLSNPNANFDEEAFSASSDGKAYIVDCSAAWGDAAIAIGVDVTKARAQAKQTSDFYTGTAPSSGS